MKELKFFTLIVINLFQYSTSISQVYSEDNREFIYKNNISYQLKTKETDDKYGYKSVLEVYKLRSGEKQLFKSIELKETGYDADLISFGQFIDDLKKFVLIRHRYSFYILNLYNQKVLGPYKPKFFGIGQDAQSGMITDLNIILKGRFLCGYSVDCGTFLYDLTHLYQTKEVLPATCPYYHQNHVYILQQLDNKEKQFGLYVSTEDWKTQNKILFTAKQIENKTFPESCSEFPEDDYVSDIPLAVQKYTVLKEILIENDYIFIVIDNNNGKQINLPVKLMKSNQEKIHSYLNNQ